MAAAGAATSLAPTRGALALYKYAKAITASSCTELAVMVPFQLGLLCINNVGAFQGTCARGSQCGSMYTCIRAAPGACRANHAACILVMALWFQRAGLHSQVLAQR